MSEELRGQEAAPPTERQIAHGRTAVRVLIAGMLGLSLAWILAYVTYRGPERLLFQIVRFGLEAGLMVLLYRGLPWARWLTVAWLSMAAILYFITGGISGAALLDVLAVG